MILLFVALLLDPVGSREMRWKFDSDISNPANWIGGGLAKDCNGIHFAPVNDAPVFIKELSTQELTLPQDGEIYVMDGGVIEFKGNKKCIKLKPINYHDWYDDESWENSGANVAIPNKERIPCDHDDVHFPKGIHTRVTENYFEFIPTKSIKFGDDLVTDDEMEDFMDTETGKAIFFNPIDSFTFDITSKSCTDPRGCFCHKENIPCPMKTYQKKTNCLNPVEPEDFCHEICGAYITFKPTSDFRLDELRKQLKKYESDTHASRVTDYLGNDIIQVVFSEKEYTGRSVEEAASFLDSMKIEGAQMLKSGKFYAEGKGGSVLGIVFGTLVTVATFFVVLLYINGDTRLDLIISRFNRGRGSVFTVPFFARFDNTDENLIIDSQSVTGSVLDLPKSFDNPLFDHPAPETSKEEGSRREHENPLFDVKLKEQDEVDGAEE